MNSHRQIHSDDPSILSTGSESVSEERTLKNISLKVEIILCYATLWAGAIVILALEKANRLVIFNAYQSLLFSGIMTALSLPFTFLFGLPGFISVMLVALAISLVLGFAASNSDTEIKMPFIGDVSSKKAESIFHLKDGII